MSQPEKPRPSGWGDVTIQVTGKNVEASEAFQSYVTDRITGVLDKFFGPELSGHVRVEKERGRFHTQFSIRLKTGLLIAVRGDGADAYASADAAIERLEKRVRRYKRRIKNRHNATAAHVPVVETDAGGPAVQMEDERDELSGAKAPLIVAETQTSLRELPVSAAVLELDGTDRPFVLFRNAARGRINVVYRRADGNIGWIDPRGNPGAA